MKKKRCSECKAAGGYHVKVAGVYCSIGASELGEAVRNCPACMGTKRGSGETVAHTCGGAGVVHEARS